MPKKDDAPKPIPGLVAAGKEAAAAPLDGELLERAQRARLVRKTRTEIGLSQSEFANRYHFPLEALQAWEASQAPVPDFVVAYIRVIAAFPDLVARSLTGGI